jgi:hypothetical protein
VTDAPSRQDPPENEDGPPDTGSAAARTHVTPVSDAPPPADAAPPADTVPPADTAPPAGAQPPQWSADQPAAAPWYLGQPGAAPPPAPYPASPPAAFPPPLPPPNPDQANWPNQPPGTRPEGSGAPGAQAGQPAPPQQSSGVPPWTGQAPQSGQQQGQQSGPPHPAPWHDPNRYARPGTRPQQQGPSQRPPYQPPDRRDPEHRADPLQRPELSLRTRWARGLAVGGFACVVITVLNGYQNLDAWLFGAATGLALSLTGLWFGAFAQRDASRQAKRAPEAVAAIVWSSISSLMALSLLSLSLIFYPQLSQYANCMRAANTIAGQKACQTDLNNSMTFKP